MQLQLLASAGDEITLRPASADDAAFLGELHADRWVDELAPPGWSVAQRDQLVSQQVRAQEQGYAEAYPDADHWIPLDQGMPVGRLLVARRRHEHRVVDLVILRSARGRGIGTALMRAVLEDAAAAGVPVALRVAGHEQSLVDWYRRLGFSAVGAGEAHLGMLSGVG
jgi:ribosomal protein S18 acetylase RimI-like enzyme